MEVSTTTHEIYLMMALGIFMMLALALALIVFFFSSQKKLLQKQMQSQQMLLAHQQQLLYATLSTQEQERQRIAKDLHDEVGSKLSVLFLNLRQLRKTFYTDVQMQEVLQDMNQVINNTIATTRRISHDLLPPTLENFGLVAALKELFESYQKNVEIEIVLEIYEEGEFSLNHNDSLQLFRVIQELLSNSLKYATAKTIKLKFRETPEQMRLEYTDDGKGFDLSAQQNQKGLGLQNIESRLKMIGATHQWKTALGEGVQVNIKLEH